MDSQERDKLEKIHTDLNEAKEDVQQIKVNTEVLDERTDIINEKVLKVDNRVFGPDGINNQVQKNRSNISRLHSVAVLVVGATSTVVAKILDLL